MPFGVRLGLIGCGKRGAYHLLSLRSSRFIRVVAVADLYDGHLLRAQEIMSEGSIAPSQLFATRDYRQVLNRADIDALIIAVPDFWQEQIFTAAVAAGKHVYCEAPFGQTVAAGERMLAAANKSGTKVQIGSGVPSSVACQRAREIVASGQLGTIYFIDIVRDVATSLGSWRAPLPLDASPETVDWSAFQQAAAHFYPFNLLRFFQWRLYKDYGSGLAGDALIDSLTAMQWITNCGEPIKVSAAGGNFRWHDGREIPDIFQANLVYPSFDVHLCCSMTTSFRGHRLSFCGSNATLILKDSRGRGFDSLRVLPEPEAEPYVEAVTSWPRWSREWYYMEHGIDSSGHPMREPTLTVAEQAWSDVADQTVLLNPYVDSLLGRHLSAFVGAITGRQQINEPAALGFQAAKLAHLADDAYRQASNVHSTSG